MYNVTVRMAEKIHSLQLWQLSHLFEPLNKEHIYIRKCVECVIYTCNVLPDG